MATTTGHLEQFPGAYSGTGAAWERKAREAIGLLPDKYGLSPSVVLGPKPPDTIKGRAEGAARAAQTGESGGRGCAAES